ncbi:hypothetical protein PR048_013661 [Dryococelus australis]|uniref:Uncharacterized protein n=1 Tax=Dryococelus australis TaxID=614101 RepID=A0ABQ9HST4_9NEOP|nr:hypothetical protein PR048_013661 [Dryococelus australis]
MHAKYPISVLRTEVGGRGRAAGKVLVSHPGEPGRFPAGSLPLFARGNRAGRCRWSAGFLAHIPFPPFPCNSSATPYPPRFTLIGSRDLAVNSRANLATPFEPKYRAGRCHWSAGFLGDLPFRRPFILPLLHIHLSHPYRPSRPCC